MFPLINLPGWSVPLLALLLNQVAVLNTTIYLHRGLAHDAIGFHPVFACLCRIVNWMFTGQNRREWVAVHRKHHTFTDVEGDPHSPKLLGFWRVQLLNVVYYIREARNPETLRKFAPDIEEGWLERHTTTGVLTGLGLLYILFGWWAVAAGLLHGVLYVFGVAPLINAVGHKYGQQNFSNTAHNSRLLAWVTGGESLHNNHHARQRVAKFSVGKREFDPGWGAIKTLNLVGLVSL